MGLAKKPRVHTSISFTVETRDRLTAAARERDVSLNWLVERACVDFLDRLIPVEEIKWTR